MVLFLYKIFAQVSSDSGAPSLLSLAHAGLVALVAKLREDPGSFGLITANGGFLSKHAAGIYSCAPYLSARAAPQRWEGRANSAELQSGLDAGAECIVDETPTGRGVVQTYTVTYNAKGMYRAMVIGELHATGHRFVAISEDPALMTTMEAKDMLGAAINVHTDDRGRGIFSLAVKEEAAKL